MVVRCQAQPDHVFIFCRGSIGFLYQIPSLVETIGGKVFFVLPTTIGKVIVTDDIEMEMLTKVL
jgi:hypothetical protein